MMNPDNVNTFYFSKRSEVDSSFADEIYYHKGRLLISVKGGDLLEYSGVPEDVFDSMVSAPSVGRFYQTMVRGRYPLEASPDFVAPIEEFYVNVDAIKDDIDKADSTGAWVDSNIANVKWAGDDEPMDVDEILGKNGSEGYVIIATFKDLSSAASALSALEGHSPLSISLSGSSDG